MRAFPLGSSIALFLSVVCTACAITPHSHDTTAIEHGSAAASLDTPATATTPADDAEFDAQQSTKQGEQTSAAERQDDDKLPREKIRIGKHIFELEVAADSESRAKGLMEREELDEDEGMIFVYPTGTRTLSFWMKNCLIDIDLAFLNSRGRVIALHEMKAEEPRGEDEPLWKYESRLERYESGRAAQYAVELKAGMIEKLEIELGDEILFDREKLAKLARENEKKEREKDVGDRQP